MIDNQNPTSAPSQQPQSDITSNTDPVQSLPNQPTTPPDDVSGATTSNLDTLVKPRLLPVLAYGPAVASILLTIFYLISGIYARKTLGIALPITSVIIYQTIYIGISLAIGHALNDGRNSARILVMVISSLVALIGFGQVLIRIQAILKLQSQIANMPNESQKILLEKTLAQNANTNMIGIVVSVVIGLAGCFYILYLTRPKVKEFFA